MATCKDCLHDNLCDIKQRYNHPKYALQHIEKYCQHFKDRSRFVELPCKVGDFVYWDILGKPVEDRITNITIYDNVTRVFLKKGLSFDIEDIGRMIFLTREEAEQALAKRKQNGNTP
jgi:hypothetical protein